MPNRYAGHQFDAFDHLQEGVQVIAPDWSYAFINHAAAQQGRASKAELTGSLMLEKYPGIEHTEVFRLIRECMVNRTYHELENRFTFPDGSSGWFKLSIEPVDEGVLILSCDITDLKQVELNLQNQLQERERMLTQLLEQKKQLEDLTQIIAHNMRAPLSNLMLLADLTRSANSVDEKLMYLEKQEPVVRFLNELFDELVDASQVRADYGISKDRVNLKQVLEKVVALLQGQISRLQATVQENFAEAPEVVFPAKYVDSLIFNLVSNALKYASPHRKPEIRIRSYVKAEWIHLEVADNGLGIDLERHRHKIFKLRKTFHNHPDAKGFGLFITKTHLDTLGGSIWVDSTPDVGSTFTARICPITKSSKSWNQ